MSFSASFEEFDNLHCMSEAHMAAKFCIWEDDLFSSLDERMLGIMILKGVLFYSKYNTKRLCFCNIKLKSIEIFPSLV